MTIEWIDAGREPQHPPNPLYPDGVDLDFALGVSPACRVDLPYPARRCGQYVVRCDVCGLTSVVTTAGRPDDPRSLTVACKTAAAQQ